MISGMTAGQGIDAIESRIRQIEGLVQSVQQRQAPVTQSAESTKPFQFYLKNAPQASAAPGVSGEKPFKGLVEQLSSSHGVDADLVTAVIQQESGFNPQAVSSAGAQGLMQLMPGTAKSLGVHQPMDPVQNMDGGIRYLKSLLEQFHGNVPLALAAYNAGPGAVNKHQGIPPYKETQNYVRRVLAMYLQNRQEA